MDSSLRRGGDAVLCNNNTIRRHEYVTDTHSGAVYVKGKFLGKGGFARVHEMTDLKTNTVYAGKIIPKSRICKPQHREKIFKEISLHKTLKHKNVVQFHNYFEDHDNVYIILEYCSRKSLVHVLRKRRCLAEAEARYFMHQLAAGVKYIHAEGVVHRDLKLGNMLLSDNMQVKIGDFGLAMRLDGDKTPKTTVCGTPNYIAPEVLNVEGHSFAADVWALGCILYAMLVGQPPFETSTITETYNRISNSRYSVPSTVSKPARDLITQLLQKDPDRRPSIAQIQVHEFFTSGWIPKYLSPYYCSTQSRRLQSIGHSNRSTPVVSDSTDRIQKLNTSLPALHIQSPPLVVARKAPEKTQNKIAAKPHENFGRTLKKKLTSLFRRRNGSKRKESSTLQLSRVLETCLKDMPEGSSSNPLIKTSKQITLVVKWIDYSNKYGFGYQISDQRVGVLFNDGSTISYVPHIKQVEHRSKAGKKSHFSSSNCPNKLKEQFLVLEYFAHYMEENLSEGGTLRCVNPRYRKGPTVYLKRWIRTSNCVIMELSNGTVQMNFLADHTKLVFSGSRRDRLTYVDQGRTPIHLDMGELKKKGCQTRLSNQLNYALSILQEFAEAEAT